MNSFRFFQSGPSLLSLSTLLAGLLLFSVTALPLAAAADTFTATGAMSAARRGHTAIRLPDARVLVAGGFNNDGTLATAELYDPVTGAWTATGALLTARSGHTAVLLQNGKVLVNGGRSASGVALASAELYDPATGVWTATGNMLTARRHHTATLLISGEVVVAGGTPDDTGAYSFNTSEFYDPSTGLWAEAGLMKSGRSFHTAVSLGGYVYIFGGVSSGGGFITNIEFYSLDAKSWLIYGATSGTSDKARKFHTTTVLPDSTVLIAGGVRETALSTTRIFAGQSWIVTGPLSSARSGHTATLLPGGQVLIAGGADNAGSPLAGSETYDQPTGKWTAADSLETARAGHTATLLPGGRVLITGGYNAGGTLASCELYTAKTALWSLTAPLGAGRMEHASNLLPDGRVLVSGGKTPLGFSRPGSAEIYDPGLDSWLAAAPPVTRHGHTSTLLANGLVLVSGGYDYPYLSGIGTYLDRADLYDSAADRWISTGPLRTARAKHAAVLLPDGKVFVAGGGRLSKEMYPVALSSAEIYDPAAGTWSVAAPMSVERPNPGAALLDDGRVLVLNGYDQGHNGYLPGSAEIYNPAAGTWSTAGTLLFPHLSPSVTLLPDGQVLVAGGIDILDKSSTGTAEIYNPVTNTWRAAAPMKTEGIDHKAVLLHDGRVLVTGSYHYNGFTGSRGQAEIYAPGTDSWSLSGDYKFIWHSASLLPDGKVFLAGGLMPEVDYTLVNTQTFDPYFALDKASRPVITSAAFDSAGRLAVSGTGFTGATLGEAPVVKLRRLEGGQTVSLLPDPAAPWTGNSFTSLPLTGFPQGHVMVTVFAGGIPSVSSIIPGPSPELRVERVGTGAELANGAQADFGSVKPGESAELSFVIKNTGALALGGLAVTFSGTDAALFSLATAPAETVSGPDGSTSFTVRFSPDTPGTKTTALHLASTDANRNPFILLLTGSGANTAPVITGLMDHMVDEDGQVAIPFTVTDAETPGGAFTLSASSSNPALLPDSRIAFGGSGAGRTLGLAVNPHQSGTTVITVTVSDGVLQGSAQFTLTVTPLNDAPTLAAFQEAAFILEDAGPQTLQLTGLSAGPGEEGEPFTVTAVSSNPSLIAHPQVSHSAGAATGSLTYAPAPNASGTAVITVTVSDGQAQNSAFSRTLTVTVLPVNDPPALAAIAAPAPVPEDSGAQSVSFSGVSAGPGEEGQTLTVTAVSNNPAVIPHPSVSYRNPQASGTLSFTPVPNAHGTAVITIAVSDGQSTNSTVSRSFTVTVLPVNDPPTLNAITAPAPLREDGERRRVNFTGVSAGAGDAEAVSVTAVSSNAALIPHPVVTYNAFAPSGSLEFAPAPDRSGSAVITVTVDDGRGGPESKASQSFTVRVLPLVRGEAATITEGGEGNASLRFRLFINDPQTEAVRVNYSTAAGTAQTGSDFTVVSGEAVVAPGETETFVEVAVKGDAEFELDETLSLVLSSPSGAFLQSASLTGVIANDDPQAALALTPGSVTESAAGGPFLVWVKAILPAPSALPLSWTVRTRESTARAGADFKPLGPVTLTFAPGETVKWVATGIAGSKQDTAEGDEEFHLDFTAAAGPPSTQSAPCVIRQLAVRDFVPLNAGFIAVRFPTGTGQSYVVEEAETLSGPWSAAGPEVEGNGSIATQVVFSSERRRFFRVKAAPAAPGPAAVGP